MDSSLTKAEFLNDLRAVRAEWDELIAKVGEARMTHSGVAGYWSVKDVVAHLTAIDQWNANALRAHARDEPPPAINEQQMALEERNRLHYEQNRQRSLHDVLQESRQVFQQLVELLQDESEEFLTQPQVFENLAEPVVVWKSLKYACADHYRHHMPDIRAWLERSEQNC
jgi:hypothetical protein